MAAVQSLVERGTWAIDGLDLARTGDRILVDGHFYSDKPPVLSLFAAGVYSVLHRSFHLELGAQWCDADAAPCHCRIFCDQSPDWAYYLLTLILVGLPSAALLALFYHLATLVDLSDAQALLLTAALGFGTPIFPYSTVFNSHVPAAATLLAGFYALIRAREGGRVSRWLFLAGLLLALASTFDLGVGLFLIAFACWLLWKVRLRAWPFVFGALIPLALMVLLDYQIVGGPLPPYMFTQGYNYPGSRFLQTIAGNRKPDNYLMYGFRLLFGDHGLFAFTPTLLWAVVAWVRVSSNSAAPSVGKLRLRQRVLAAPVGLAVGLFTLYFVLFTDNFGGAAYGARWYTVFVPLLFFFVAVEWRRMARRRWYILFAALLLVSLVNSYWGALNPWRTVTPLVRLELAGRHWRDPVHVALSGVGFEELPSDLRAGFGLRRVDKRWFDAREALVVPSGPAWIVVGPGTPLDAALREWSGLGDCESLMTFEDLRSVRDLRIEQLEKQGWASVIPAPTDPDTLLPVRYPVHFGDRLVLLGYEWLSGELKAGQEASLLTVWRIEDKPGPQTSIFVHLIGVGGGMVGQSDGLGANPDALYPGDVLVRIHRFTVSSDAAPGQYWVEVGVYDWLTMKRVHIQDEAAGWPDRILIRQVDVSGEQ